MAVMAVAEVNALAPSERTDSTPLFHFTYFVSLLLHKVLTRPCLRQPYIQHACIQATATPKSKCDELSAANDLGAHRKDPVRTAYVTRCYASTLLRSG